MITYYNFLLNTKHAVGEYAELQEEAGESSETEKHI